MDLLKMNFQKTIYTLLLIILPVLADAQVRIYGKVTDADNQPIEFATVRIGGTSIGTNTGLDGSYALSAVGCRSRHVGSDFQLHRLPGEQAENNQAERACQPQCAPVQDHKRAARGGNHRIQEADRRHAANRHTGGAQSP